MADFLKRGKAWYFRFVNAEGRRVMRKGCPDRRVTEDPARAAESEVAKIKAGLIDLKVIAQAAHESRPLSDHLDDWRQFLIAKGSTRQHADLSHNRVARLIELARAKRISDLSPSRVQSALKEVRTRGFHFGRSGITRERSKDSRAGSGGTADLVRIH
jgi:hypothetical protein